MKPSVALIVSCFLFLLIRIFFSCSKNDLLFQHVFPVNAYMTKSDIKIDSALFVSQDDINSYAIIQSFKHGKSIVSISPVLSYGILTSYIIQYESGWEIVSSDKRGPIVLALGEEGSYNEEDMPPAAIEWIESLNGEIAYRWSLNLPINLNDDRESESVEFWKNVTFTLGDESIITKVGDPNAPIGHIELISVEYTPMVYDSIPHLTSTLWSQHYPYNYACPFQRGSTIARVPAGCGAVALSQMLYYLHDSLGVPELAPSYAICTGDIDNYTFDIPEPNSSTIWDSMLPMGGYSDCSYVLVADAANRLNTIFTDTTGTTYFSDFPDYFYDYYTNHRVSDTLILNLSNNLPVVMRGACTDSLGHDHGHFFLVDGFIRYRDEIRSTYRKVWDPPRPISLDDDIVLISYSTPYIELIKMNWGWGNCLHKDDSYSLTGTWLAAEDCIFDHGYYMLSGFHVL